MSAAKIAAGAVVTSLNGLKDNVTLAAGSGVTVTPNGNTLTIGTSGASPSWLLAGNAGTTAGQFVGTTDNQPLELRANGKTGLKLSFADNFGLGFTA